MELLHVDIDKLKLTNINMRHGKKAPDVSDILPSIRARGVLTPLLVRPNGDGESFEIVAGRRRYFASKKVQKDKGKSVSLPCAVMEKGDDAAALEASLLENFARLNPDEMTQYECFARLIKEGKSVAKIAATFGITELMVKRRMALGNLLPKIRKAYRNEEIEAETIRHLTMATKAQQKKWLKLYEDDDQYAPTGYQLRNWLFDGNRIATDAALFPLEDYQGSIISDLFGERDYFSGPDQFWKLQNEAIAGKRDALLKDGWKEIVLLDVGENFPHWQFVETPKEEGGKVYITVGLTGYVHVFEGFLSEKEARKNMQKSAGSDGEDEPEAKKSRPEITKVMQNYLELHRHLAVRDRLLEEPKVALRLMIAHAINGSGLWRIQPEPQTSATLAIRESVRKADQDIAFHKKRKKILKLLGLPEHQFTVVNCSYDTRKTAEIFARVLALSDNEVMKILPFVMAETLQSGSTLVEALGVHLNVNMADYWQADDLFFDLLRDKNVINDMLKEVGGKQVADANVTATAKAQKKIIQDYLGGREGRKKVTDWLPRFMMFPFKSYADNGSIHIQQSWQAVKDRFKDLKNHD